MVKKTSCSKTEKNKYLGMIMTHIKNFWKYKKKINIVVYFHIFQLLNWVKQKDVGLFISPVLKEVLENMWVGLYIDYIARLTSFKLPLSFLLGRLKKRG